MAKLKKFSYYVDHGSLKGTQFYIIATSQKQVVELLNSVGKYCTLSDVKNFVYKAWGDDGEKTMEGIEITEPSVYSVKREHMFGKFIEKPKKLSE
jgi:hypothetical protein